MVCEIGEECYSTSALRVHFEKCVQKSKELNESGDARRRDVFVLIISTFYFYARLGSGVALISNFEQLLRGVWRPETNEILNMSL